jgi:hypothetical protein
MSQKDKRKNHNKSVVTSVYYFFIIIIRWEQLILMGRKPQTFFNVWGKKLQWGTTTGITISVDGYGRISFPSHKKI